VHNFRFQYSLSFEDFLISIHISHTLYNECSDVCWKQKNEICVNYNYSVFTVATSTSTICSLTIVLNIFIDFQTEDLGRTILRVPGVPGGRFRSGNKNCLPADPYFLSLTVAKSSGLKNGPFFCPPCTLYICTVFDLLTI